MGMWQRLRRPDWLGEVQAVLVAGLVLAAVIGVVNLAALAQRAPIVVNVLSEQVLSTTDLSGVRPNVRVHDGGTVEVLVDHPTAAQLFWHTAGSLPMFLVVVFMLVTLLRIVRAARRDDPFSAANVRRLRAMGGVVLVGGASSLTIGVAAAFELGRSIAPDAAPGAVLDLSGWWFLVGFGFFAIAEVLNRGRAMRAELDEVI